MATWRYEISLLVLKNIVKYFSNMRTDISYLQVFRCERRDLSCSHSNGDIFTCEDNMLFSHVKISSFRAKAHLVFHWCLYNNKLSYPTLATILDRSKEAIGKKLIQLCN